MGMTFAYGPADDREALRTAHRALELGVNLLDTADFYGPHSNEEFVARVIAGRRDSITVSSEGRQRSHRRRHHHRPPQRPPRLHPHLHRRHPAPAGHRPPRPVLPAPRRPRRPRRGIHRRTRRPRHRLQGPPPRHLRGVRRHHPPRPRRAPAHRRTDRVLPSTRDVEANGVLAAVRELGIGFVGYSPLGRGLLTGAIRSLDALAAHDFRRVVPRFQQGNLETNLHIVEQAQALAAAKKITAGQLALAWVLAQGDDIVAIPGTKRVTYLEENLAACAVELSAADLAALDEIAPHGSTAGDRYPVGAMATLDG